MSRSLLEDAFEHHVWATMRLIDTCLTLSAEQVETAVPGTYGSILETMRHLVGADSWYLFDITGDLARAGAPSRDRPSESDLHRVDGARRTTALDRRLGLRRPDRPDRRDPPALRELGHNFRQTTSTSTVSSARTWMEVCAVVQSLSPD
jgi:uncharacterized damage-inducible protein DinB